MKICLITNIAPHYREEIYRLIDREFQCDFVFGDTLGNGIRTFAPMGFRNEVRILKNIQKGEVTLWQKGVLKMLGRKYDAYLVSGDIRCFSTWMFLLLSRLSCRKVYMWAHGWSGRENPLTRILKKIFYRFPDGIFLYGFYARELMIDEGFRPEKLWVIHNSLAYSVQKNIRSVLKKTDIYRRHFSNSDPTLIFIGRLTASKKLDMIIAAMKLLKKDACSCNLVLVGAGWESEYLRMIALENGLDDRVWFYGPCYDEERSAELIYNADLCVSPGNIGLTAIHVMTYGTPAVTHDSFLHQGPEFEAIHPLVTGDFFKYGSVVSLAETIRRWLSDKKNDRDAVRRACYEEIDNYWTPEYQLEVLNSHLK